MDKIINIILCGVDTRIALIQDATMPRARLVGCLTLCCQPKHGFEPETAGWDTRTRRRCSKITMKVFLLNLFHPSFSTKISSMRGPIYRARNWNDRKNESPAPSGI